MYSPDDFAGGLVEKVVSVFVCEIQGVYDLGKVYGHGGQSFSFWLLRLYQKSWEISILIVRYADLAAKYYSSVFLNQE